MLIVSARASVERTARMLSLFLRVFCDVVGNMFPLQQNHDQNKFIIIVTRYSIC